MKQNVASLALAGVGIAVVVLVACGDSNDSKTRVSRSSGAPKTTSSSIVTPAVLSVFGTLPLHYHQAAVPSKELVDLGRMLYYEPRLSKSGTISCNSCHLLDRFGVDGEQTSPGHDGTRGERNSPTSLNAAGHFVQFWDGRASSVEEQAKGPVLNPIEHGVDSEETLVAILKAIPGYVAAFKAAFPETSDPITFDHFATAIGAFERGLVTPSRFDDFFSGKQDALNYQEQMGLKGFFDAGCHTCHMGAHFGAQTYDKLGKVKPWPGTVADKGRSVVTGQSSDDLMFKVPSLRNVTKTAPYLHDGSIADLKEVITLMSRHQLGKELSKSDVESIVAFLATLEGRVDPEYTKKPTLPE